MCVCACVSLARSGIPLYPLASIITHIFDYCFHNKMGEDWFPCCHCSEPIHHEYTFKECDSCEALMCMSCYEDADEGIEFEADDYLECDGECVYDKLEHSAQEIAEFKAKQERFIDLFNHAQEECEDQDEDKEPPNPYASPDFPCMCMELVKHTRKQMKEDPSIKRMYLCGECVCRGPIYDRAVEQEMIPFLIQKAGFDTKDDAFVEFQQWAKRLRSSESDVVDLVDGEDDDDDDDVKEGVEEEHGDDKAIENKEVST